jgi:hypothetical protein
MVVTPPTVTPPPCRTCKPPNPSPPSVRSPEISHRELLFSTRTFPLDVADRPSTPTREFTTAPPRIVTAPIPLSPTTNWPVFAAADVTFTVVPAPVIVPRPMVFSTPPPKITFPGVARVAPPESVKSADWLYSVPLPTTNAPVAASLPVLARAHAPLVICVVPRSTRRWLRELAPAPLNTNVPDPVALSPNPPPPSVIAPPRATVPAAANCVSAARFTGVESVTAPLPVLTSCGAAPANVIAPPPAAGASAIAPVPVLFSVSRFSRNGSAMSLVAV